MDDRKVLKLHVILEMLEGKEPLIEDYEGEDGYAKGEFNKIVAEMQNEDRYIEDVIFSHANKFDQPIFKHAKVTQLGKHFFETEKL
jgi:hypothetical protein